MTGWQDCSQRKMNPTVHLEHPKQEGVEAEPLGLRQRLACRAVLGQWIFDYIPLAKALRRFVGLPCTRVESVESETCRNTISVTVKQCGNAQD